jgi:DNA-directed RNA polymerase subunit RPC12/RpoP
MSLTTRYKCPACGADVLVAVTPELLREAAEKGAVRALARCPRGHAAVLAIDQYGQIRSALPVREQARPDCEITDKAPMSVRARLAVILEKGPVTDADALLLEKAKAAGWVICL